MARTFNGTSDEMVCNVGSSNLLFGTMMVICRTVTDTGSRCYICNRDNGGAQNRASIFFAATVIQLRFSGTVSAPTLTHTTADGWCLIAATKATGNVTPRFHKYVYSTDTYTPEDAAATQANANSTVTQLNVGHRNSDQRWSGDIALVAIWNGTALTNAQVQSCAYSLDAIFALAPTTLLVLDQFATAMNVPDFSGNNGGQSSLTGTSVATSGVPLAYCSPIPDSTAPSAAAPAATSLVIPRPSIQALLGM